MNALMIGLLAWFATAFLLAVVVGKIFKYIDEK